VDFAFGTFHSDKQPENLCIYSPGCAGGLSRRQVLGLAKGSDQTKDRDWLWLPWAYFRSAGIEGKLGRGQGSRESRMTENDVDVIFHHSLIMWSEVATPGKIQAEINLHTPSMTLHNSLILFIGVRSI